MIIDKLLRVSEDQAVTATAVSTDTIDLGTARDIGEGRDLFVVFTVTEAFAALTSLTFEVITSAAAALSSPTVIAATGAVALANLGVGKQYIVQIPPRIASLGQRYLGVRYTVAGNNATAGKVTADIVLDIQDGQKFHASGFSVT